MPLEKKVCQDLLCLPNITQVVSWVKSQQRGSNMLPKVFTQEWLLCQVLRNLDGRWNNRCLLNEYGWNQTAGEEILMVQGIKETACIQIEV